MLIIWSCAIWSCDPLQGEGGEGAEGANRWSRGLAPVHHADGQSAAGPMSWKQTPADLLQSGPIHGVQWKCLEALGQPWLLMGDFSIPMS